MKASLTEFPQRSLPPVAIEPLGIVRELQETRTRLSTFKNLVAKMNSGLEVQQVIEGTVTEVQKSFSGLRLVYCTIDDGDRLKIVSSVSPTGLPEITGMEFDVSHAEEFLYTLKTDEMLMVCDVGRDLRMAPLRGATDITKSKALLMMAVKHPKEGMGFVCMSSIAAHEWSPYEMATLGDMAEYLAIAKWDAYAQQERKKMDMQVREAQKMEMVGQLVGCVAHDFNNLITGMMIYCGLLSAALGKEHPLMRHVTEIQNAGGRGAELVGQLLSLTRQQVLEPRVLSLNKTVAGMEDMLRRLIGEEIKLETNLQYDLSLARLDPSQIQQVILNLAINARDAMHGGGKLMIRTDNVMVDEEMCLSLSKLKAGQHVRLQVQDSGEGMDARVMAHIFEPFFTTKATGKGTGLGLASAYGIVHQHGGQIAVVSAPKQGTTFELYFPVACEPSGIEAPAHFRTAAEATLPTILLVEDEDIVRVPLLEMLQQEGFSVLAAAEAEQAMSVSESHTGLIHLMITDLVMPGLSGRELAEHLMPQRPGMKVLYISGYTDDPRTRRLLNEGVDFLRKPFSRETLVRKVKQMLEGGGPENEHEVGPDSPDSDTPGANGPDPVTRNWYQ